MGANRAGANRLRKQKRHRKNLETMAAAAEKRDAGAKRSPKGAKTATRSQ
jgi:hypothetical protein